MEVAKNEIISIEDNLLPIKWNKVRLKNLCIQKPIYGINIPNSKYTDYGVRFLRTTDIDEDGNIDNDGIFIDKRNVPSEYILKKGDLLFSRSGTIGRCYLHSEEIEYTYAGFLVKFQPVNFNVSKWLYYYSFSKHFKYQLFSEAIESTISNFNANKYATLRINFPEDENELKNILSFLDYKCEQINRFINNKIEFIRILKEQRQSVIDRAVTKGIKSNVDLISSGYDFIGDIPKHWKIKRLGVLGNFSKGGNISRAELLYDTVGINAILYGDIYTKYDIQAKNIINQISKKTADKAIKVYYDDLLFTGSGETKEDIGKCIVVKCKEEVYAGGDVIIFRQEDNDSHFIAYSQNSSFAKYQKAISSKGDIIVHTYGSKLKNVVMPYPEIEEQKEIVKYIKEETKNIDELIAKAEKEIILIKEYKESLISHAVTGQLQNVNYKK